MSGSRASDAPRLVMTANLWTLAGHPRPGREWSLARKVRAVAEAGFDAVTAPASPELAALLRQHGLRYMGFFSSGKRAELARLLAAQRDAGAEVINVQLGDDDTPHTEALALLLALFREGDRQGVYTAVEVHRDTITETPEKVRRLAADFEQATGAPLELTLDHSHPAVVKHLKPHLYAEKLLEPMAEVQRARLMHLRPFNGQHAQVPVMNGRDRLTPEFRQWLEWVDELWARWLAGPRPGGELWVCPEIGPVGIHGYNLSVFPPSWDQALRAAKVLRRRWSRAVRLAG